MTHPNSRDLLSQGVAGAQLVRVAREVASVVSSHAEQTEQQRTPAEPSLKALREAGLFALGTPRCYGGRGAGVRTAVDVCAELAAGCASSSWLVGIAYGAALFASQLPDEVRTAIWTSDPDALLCGAANPSGAVTAVPGGLQLSGRWPWISGIDHAAWVLLGIVREDRGRPERGLALVPASALTAADTWHMAGMRGTGSHTALAQQLFVPDEQFVSFAEIAEGIGIQRHPDEARVVFPLSINLPLVGTGVGIARSALELVVRDLAGGKRSVSPLHSHTAEAAPHQLNVAQAATLIDTATLHVRRAADEIDEAACAGRRPDLETRARLRMDGSHAMRCAREAVSLLLDTAGASSFSDDSPLQRAWRDIGTASRHAALSVETSRELYGRVLLGRPLPHTDVV
ncbi:acyl-CoA dehydrogenase family protein [Streptomyces xylophagus]|uniref:acyl-CoA dehydrogenase family protein n=1 Tax=Streptomyces xylophagus TaxID=285514 RepID=UPI0005BA0C0D|nr:acyl-CoA dehydrogenase family protein [Streptomyces xylophagus]